MERPLRLSYRMYEQANQWIVTGNPAVTAQPDLGEKHARPSLSDYFTLLPDGSRTKARFLPGKVANPRESDYPIRVRWHILDKCYRN
jgi:hypothetical protein